MADGTPDLAALIDTTGEHWLWMGPTHHGNGFVTVRRKWYSAHRWVYEQHFGPVPDGHRALHACGERLCVRPDHLTVKRYHTAPLGDDVATLECTGCGERKPIAEFHAKRHSTAGRNTRCRDCVNRYHRTWNARVDPVHGRRIDSWYQAKHRLGITPERYAEMVGAQEGRCAICKRQPDRTLHIDHDHATGAVRDLLCEHCNKGLGQFHDDPSLLRAAADYLERHNREV